MVVQPALEPPSFAALLADVRATACAGVPTTYAMLCQVPEDKLAGIDTSALQVASSAEALLPSRIRSEFQGLYGAPVLNCYRITEAAGDLTAMMSRARPRGSWTSRWSARPRGCAARPGPTRRQSQHGSRKGGAGGRTPGRPPFVTPRRRWPPSPG